MQRLQFLQMLLTLVPMIMLITIMLLVPMIMLITMMLLMLLILRPLLMLQPLLPRLCLKAQTDHLHSIAASLLKTCVCSLCQCGYLEIVMVWLTLEQHAHESVEAAVASLKVVVEIVP